MRTIRIVSEMQWVEEWKKHNKENFMSRLALSAEEIILHLPQQPPFRFIDEITALNSDHIIGTYTFKQNESFYAGHFPGKPVTPGVILLESMAQVGVVSLGMYLYSLEVDRDELMSMITFFSDAEVEFFKPVFPGEKVFIKGQKIFWRRMKLRTKIEMRDDKGNLLAATTASGVGVRK